MIARESKIGTSILLQSRDNHANGYVSIYVCRQNERSSRQNATRAFVLYVEHPPPPP